MSRCVTLAQRIEAAARRALASLSGEALVRAALTERTIHATRLLAVGKAAWSMALGAVEAIGELEGLVVCKETPPRALPPTLTLRLAGHPRPDARSVRATRDALLLAESMRPGDELLVLISGGTSALIGGPIEGVTLAELSSLTEHILRAGRPIDELNRVRRRLGAALGGRLMMATQAGVRALVISDVAGDDLRVIGSGPLSAPPIDDGEAAALIAAELGAPPQLIGAIRDAAPSTSELASRLATSRADIQIVARPQDLADAAERALGEEGFVVRKQTSLVHGPVEVLASKLADEAAALAPGHAFVIAGEPTVVVRGEGRGGRAQHTALLLVERLRALGDRAVLTLASDGTDGPTDAAGALVTSDSQGSSVDVAAALAAHDSHAALGALGALVRTGPTGTNLTDLYVVARAP